MLTTITIFLLVSQCLAETLVPGQVLPPRDTLYGDAAGPSTHSSRPVTVLSDCNSGVIGVLSLHGITYYHCR